MNEDPECLQKGVCPCHRHRSVWVYRNFTSQSLQAHKLKEHLRDAKPASWTPPSRDNLCSLHSGGLHGYRKLVSSGFASIPAQFSLLDQPYHCPTWTVYKPDAHSLHHAVNQHRPPQLLHRNDVNAARKDGTQPWTAGKGACSHHVPFLMELMPQ